MTRIFIPKEVREDEKRVAATPETVKKLKQEGFEVSVQKTAGAGSFISDQAYADAGAELVDDAATGYASAGIVFKVQPPMAQPDGKHEANLLNEGSILVTGIVPQNELETVKILMDRKISCFSMNLVPRITIAQKMDSLSSQSSIAGYKAVLMAANTLPKYFPLLMTAAGTITPARVVVIGAGVAGLQAIATAKRLGAIVEASDVRPAVKEQVESLGAKFIEVDGAENLEDAGGYAKEASEDYKRRQAEELARRIGQADIVITTALIPGRPAPVIITEKMVESMPNGGVIVDLAVEQGGNCACAEPGKTVVKHGITIIGELNVPATMSIHASQLYAKNLLNLVLHMAAEGQLKIDEEEAVTTGALLTHQGQLRHEPTKALLEEKGE